ncbi:MAG: hypothetical protein AAB947_00100 [Patescibacteria group bacterium]
MTTIHIPQTFQNNTRVAALAATLSMGLSFWAHRARDAALHQKKEKEQSSFSDSEFRSRYERLKKEYKGVSPFVSEGFADAVRRLQYEVAAAHLPAETRYKEALEGIECLYQEKIHRLEAVEQEIVASGDAYALARCDAKVEVSDTLLPMQKFLPSHGTWHTMIAAGLY